MKEKINNEKKPILKMFKDKKLYIFLLITIVFFGIFQKLEFATDTYCVFVTATKQYCEHFIISGRFFSALFLAITKILALTNEEKYFISFIIAIVATTFSLYELNDIIEKYIKSEIISILISTLIIINFCSIELFLFLEKGILMLSILFCILAIKCLIKYLDGNKKSIISTFIFMLLANFSYQGTVGIFIALGSILIVKYTKNIKQFIKYNIVVGLCYAIPALINYGMVKYIFKNSRVSGEHDLILSMKKIMVSTKQIIHETFSILPQNFFLIMLIVFVVINFIVIVISNEKKTHKLFYLLGEIYVIFLIYIASVAPQLLQSTDSIGFAPRNMYTFGSIIGIISFMILSYNEENKKILTVILTIFMIIYLIVQYNGFCNIERNRYILNYIDYYNAIQIEDKVEKYEKETGNKIIHVAVYKQNGNSTSYPLLWSSGDINVKATCPDWSRKDYLKYYLNREITEVQCDQEIYKTYFQNKNWTSFNLDQIILIGDTMHMCLY